MIRIDYDGDVFSDKYSEYALCHQVNCQGRMGAGVASTVRTLYPYVYEMYKYLCNGYKEKEKLLGTSQSIIPSIRNTPVYNLFAQNNYGYDGAVYTDYKAFENALINTCKDIQDKNKRNSPYEQIKGIVMPYKIGCCRGGGDWNRILSIIHVVTSKFGIDCILVSNEPKPEVHSHG